MKGKRLQDAGNLGTGFKKQEKTKSALQESLEPTLITTFIYLVRIKQPVNSEVATPSGTFQHEVKMIQSIRSVQARRRLHDRNSNVDSEELKRPRLRVHSIEQGDLKAAKNKLKKRKIPVPEKENQAVGCKRQDTFTMFNTKLLEKFKNARSSPGDVSPSGRIDVSDSGFESP